MYDIICVGSATEDVFVGSRDMKLISVEDVHRRQAYISFEYGAKIPVDTLFASTGGGATNTAAAFARLGLRTGIISKLGKDTAAQHILDELQHEDVDTSNIVCSTDHPTGYSVILTAFTGDRTVLVHRGACTHLRKDEVNWEALANTKWIYLSSMAGPSAPLFEKVALHARDHGVKLALNPGGTQIQQGLKALRPVFEATDAVFLNKEEAYELTGVEPRQGRDDEMQVLADLLDAGPDVVVMTDGPEGAEAHDGNAHYMVPAVPVEELSTLGAGDAFAAGCIGALFHGLELRSALRAGALNAGNVIRYMDAKHGLLTWEQIQVQLAQGRRER
jgi:ribokinase